MKTIVVLILFVLTALLQAQTLPTRDSITNDKVKYEIDVDDGKVMYESDLNDNSYSYRYETADGTIKYESGHFEDGDLVVEGGYEYIGANDLVYKVTYISDKNGYRPQVSFGPRSVVSRISTTTLRSTPRITPPITPPSPLATRTPPTYLPPVTTGRPQCYPGSTDPRCPPPRPATTPGRPQCYPGSTDPRCPTPRPATRPPRPPCYPGSTDPRCPVTLATRFSTRMTTESATVATDVGGSLVMGGARKRSNKIH